MNIKKSYNEVITNYNKPYPYTTKLGMVLDYVLGSIQGFHYAKYWKRRNYVISPSCTNKLLKLYYLYWIKKIDAKNHCSFGTSYNSGARFKTPLLEHGPSGIIVGHDAIIGENCMILQQVTIAQGGVIIGDNVFMGAGAKILSGVRIGNNVRIGANAVVIEDIPDNATCVMQKPRVIIKKVKN